MTPHRSRFAAFILPSLLLLASSALPACTANVAPTSIDADEAATTASQALSSTTPPDVEWKKNDPKDPRPYKPDCPTCSCPSCGVIEGNSLVVTLPSTWQTGDVLSMDVYKPATEKIGITPSGLIEDNSKALAEVAFTAPQREIVVKPWRDKSKVAGSKRVTLPNVPAQLAALPSGSVVDLFSEYFCSTDARCSQTM